MSVDEVGLRDAVDLLVREHGRDGAERELQSRWTDHEEQPRVYRGLAVLRRGEQS